MSCGLEEPLAPSSNGVRSLRNASLVSHIHPPSLSKAGMFASPFSFAFIISDSVNGGRL
jgi:hypothetical protein